MGSGRSDRFWCGVAVAETASVRPPPSSRSTSAQNQAQILFFGSYPLSTTSISGELASLPSGGRSNAWNPTSRTVHGAKKRAPSQRTVKADPVRAIQFLTHRPPTRPPTQQRAKRPSVTVLRPRSAFKWGWYRGAILSAGVGPGVSASIQSREGTHINGYRRTPP